MNNKTDSISKKTNFRWIIVALLFYSTTIVYFDCVILGILASYITKEIGWSEQEYGYVVFACFTQNETCFNKIRIKNFYELKRKNFKINQP